ncbi:MAG: SDR family oxidoreductase [Proteobacteria bacterium]|nr:MAG: SDR family oxidoreductase [Pseudomonadota bacterium]
MNFDLKGKLALVTGSTLGIGFAIAKNLAETGATVIVNGRSEKGVEEALSKLRKEVPSGNFEAVAADLSNAEGAAKVFKAFPAIDILVNNVGIFEAKGFADITDADWTKFFETNVMSGVRLSRYYTPGMVKKNWGRVIFISSESAIMIPSEMIHYGMSKTAQLSVSRGLAETLVGTGVTVNSVLPGPTKSEGVARFVQELADQQGRTFPEMEKEFFKTMRPSSIIQRFATPEEIANLVTYVASPLSAATTGAALRADGGLVRSIL